MKPLDPAEIETVLTRATRVTRGILVTATIFFAVAAAGLGFLFDTWNQRLAVLGVLAFIVLLPPWWLHRTSLRAIGRALTHGFASTGRAIGSSDGDFRGTRFTSLAIETVDSQGRRVLGRIDLDRWLSPDLLAQLAAVDIPVRIGPTHYLVADIPGVGWRAGRYSFVPNVV